MQGSVSFETDQIVLRAADAWFAQAGLRDALGWASDNGWLRRIPGGAELTVPSERYLALGHAPAAHEPEGIDQWAFEHDALSRLLGIRDEALSVQAIGHVGGRNLKVQLGVRGAVIDVGASAPPRIVDTRGDPRVLSPLGTALAKLLKGFGASVEHNRAEHLNLIAELKRLRDAQRRLAQDSDRIRLDLDPHFDSFDVVEPEKFSVRWADAGRNRVSLQLFVEGEDEPLPLSELDDHVAVIERPGRRAVLLDPGTEAMARRARDFVEVRREKVGEEALRSPLALIPEGVETPRLDYSQYSHRILGFEPAKVERPGIAYSSGTAWYEGDDDGKTRIVLTVQGAGGALVELRFDDASRALEAAQRIEQAAQRGDSVVELQGQAVRPELQQAGQLRELVRRHYPAPEPLAEPSGDAAAEQPPRSPRHLRAVLADVKSDGFERTEPPPPDFEEAVPWPVLHQVLAPRIQLKPHQRTGIAWLWHRYTRGASGALLADDMGLGKTLQIASFVALSKLTRPPERPKRPSLLVAPVVLIDNWREELKKCFVGSFPGRLKELRDEGLRGIRLADGQLDREVLKTYDLVITSYEALARHAVSLLGIEWDIVVLDEAHRIKNRGTQWSIAARGLSGAQGHERPRKFEFAICATGTPVENAVTDLWSLYDFLSPGRPFASYEEFRRAYEKEPQAPALLAARLQVGSYSSSLMRRTKADVLRDLPSKSYERVPTAMTPFQRDQERAIVYSPAARAGGPLKILEQLQKLYQHPWLLDGQDQHREKSATDALAASPKLAACVRIVEQIQAKQEKVLIFTLWTRMQWLLKDVLEWQFKLPSIPMINGDPQNRTRAQSHIENFSATDGFAVMILSPLAAGVGLTITAANHVIHYGRWWNPAKEDQASDRAYRIGQTRPVTIYYPLLHHPEAPERGFDIKLDELVSRKRAMARMLLEPTATSDVEAEFATLISEARDA